MLVLVGIGSSKIGSACFSYMIETSEVYGRNWIFKESLSTSTLNSNFKQARPLDSVNMYRFDADIPKKQQLSLLSIGDSITSTFVKEQVFLPIRPKPNSAGTYVVALNFCQCNGIICLIDRSSMKVIRNSLLQPGTRRGRVCPNRAAH